MARFALFSIWPCCLALLLAGIQLVWAALESTTITVASNSMYGGCAPQPYKRLVYNMTVQHGIPSAFYIVTVQTYVDVLARISDKEKTKETFQLPYDTLNSCVPPSGKGLASCARTAPSPLARYNDTPCFLLDNSGSSMPALVQLSYRFTDPVPFNTTTNRPKYGSKMGNDATDSPDRAIVPTDPNAAIAKDRSRSSSAATSVPLQGARSMLALSTLSTLSMILFASLM